MKKINLPGILLILTLLPAWCLLVSTSQAQVYTNKQSKDSMAVREYPYSLPILGKKAYQAGYDLPYSAGLGINYI